MILFKFDREDTGNYRVYYRGVTPSAVRSRGAGLYCIQNDGSWGKDNFKFYSCSRDGEPSHELRMPFDTSFDKKVLPGSLVK